jgi:organic radical activating enzyme
MDKFDYQEKFQFINKPFKRIDKISQNNHTDITWILNNSCPFHCWYCPDDIHRGKNKYYEWDHCDKFLDILFERYEYCHFSLSGGEPTTWPYINQLVDKILSNPKASVGINSNLVRTQQWWDRISNKLAYVAASYHPSVLTTEDQRNEFLDKCHKIAESCSVGMRLMMDPNHWDHCLELYHKLITTERKFTVEPVRILDYFDGFDNVSYHRGYSNHQNDILSNMNTLYSTLDFHYDNNSNDFNVKVTYEDNQELLVDHVAPMVLNKVNRFNGWKCNIGIESLFISERGQLKKGNCTVGGYIGSISDYENIKWPDDKPTICTVDQCHCFTDLQLTKWKD